MRCLSAIIFSLTACASAGPGVTSADCTLMPKDDFGPTGTVAVRAEVVVSGLEVPWGLAFLPGSTDLLVTERPGRIRLVRNGSLVTTPVATVPLAPGGEGGLLGIALDADFANTRAFFIYATTGTATDKQNRVERWTLSSDSLSASFDRVLFGGIGAAQFHDGGRLRIGPDGKLYVGTGDAREPSRSQDPASLNGKLLRLNTDGTIPSDNPTPNSAVFISGIRNTQGFDWFDATTLVITDHGPSAELMRSGHDEVSIARAGDNLGWPTIYGCGTSERLVTPRITWTTAVPPGGAALYSGNAIPEWRGNLLVGVLGSAHLHRVVFDAEKRVSAHEVYFRGADTLGRIREVITGPDGELWLTTSNCDGRGSCGTDKDKIVRVVPR
ncbi:MAG: PQQ-dependent sugar dehydrogenase [Archangium sp.]|nr:PQQ-dependent sugar dehydrogenase [Archangium sp.]